MISFDGSNDNLVADASIDERAMVVVMRHNDNVSPSDARAFVFNANTTYHRIAGNYEVGAGDSNGFQSVSISSGDTTLVSIISQYELGNQVEGYFNDGTTPAGTATLGSTGSMASNSVNRIGARRDAITQHTDMELGEAIFYPNTLTQSVREALVTDQKSYYPI
jgi:hypothetical protein